MGVDLKETPQGGGFDSLVFFPLILFLVFSPFYDSLGLPDHQNAIMLMDWQRLSQILLVSCVLLVLCSSVLPVRHAYYSLPAVQFWGWLAFFAVGACSSVLAAYQRFAWIEWSWLLVCGLTASLLSLQAGRDLRSLSTIARLFVFSVIASYTPLYYIRNSDYLFESLPLWEASFWGFYNVRVFSDFQTVLFCLLPWALRQVSSSSLVRIGAWCLAGCYGALAFVAGSRSLVLGQFVACVGVWSILGRANVIPYLKGQAQLWLVSATVYVFLFVLFRMLVSDDGGAGGGLQRFQHDDGSGRLVLWSLALKLAFENPLIGIGPMHFSSIINPIAASPHNAVLQIMVEFGMAAAALSLFLVCHWLFAVFRGVCSILPSVSDDLRLFSISLLAAVLALLAQSSVSPVFNNPQSQVLLVFLTGMLGGHVKCSSGSCRQSIRRPVLVLAALVALAVFATSCLPWALHIEERNACHFALKERPTIFLAPRFWQQGWLYIPCEPLL